MKAYGATLTPYQGAGYYSDEGEQVREAVNTWIRTSGVFDGVLDFDKATRTRRIRSSTRDLANRLAWVAGFDRKAKAGPSTPRHCVKCHSG